MKTKQMTEVTLTMSGDDFKKMMNGLRAFAYGVGETDSNKTNSVDVYNSLVGRAKKCGFEWSEQ